MNILERLKNSLGTAKNLIAKIPVFGHLFLCTRRQYWETLVEYSNALIWSTMPFWLGAGILLVILNNGQPSLRLAFTSTIQNGELLVYTISTLTPITYLTLFEDPKGRFPHRLGMGTIAIIVIIICACLFSLQKGTVLTKPDYLFYASVIFAPFAVCLRFVAILYSKTKLPVPTENDFIKDKNDFFAEFEQATADR
ncbi:hypothetical protein [Ralstonia sp. 24A2]|uniref:hypothetical protein n=1 Tax=Ralstonia sp. 24A2 TaxID=3447364 RepID=UPI003F698848